MLFHSPVDVVPSAYHYHRNQYHQGNVDNVEDPVGRCLLGEHEGFPSESLEVNSIIRSVCAFCEGSCGPNEYPIKDFELPKMPKNRLRSLNALGNKSMPAYFFRIVIACSKTRTASKESSGKRTAPA